MDRLIFSVTQGYIYNKLLHYEIFVYSVLHPSAILLMMSKYSSRHAALASFVFPLL
jgi:hypothetical protein